MPQDPNSKMLARLALLEQELLAVKRELAGDDVRSSLPHAAFQVVRFTLAGQQFAAESRLVREIVRYARLTRVPGASRAVQGVLNLRGEAVPVLHVSERLGLGETRLDLKTPIVIVQVHGRSLVGLLVERVLDVVSLEPQALSLPHGGLSGGRHVIALGNVGGTLTQILDVESLASWSELEALAARLSTTPLVGALEPEALAPSEEPA